MQGARASSGGVARHRQSISVPASGGRVVTLPVGVRAGSQLRIAAAAAQVAWFGKLGETFDTAHFQNQSPQKKIPGGARIVIDASRGVRTVRPLSRQDGA